MNEEVLTRSVSMKDNRRNRNEIIDYITLKIDLEKHNTFILWIGISNNIPKQVEDEF